MSEKDIFVRPQYLDTGCGVLAALSPDRFGSEAKVKGPIE
jgi:hypothetical protein